MKTVTLKGGLGNQLFQYAYARGLELAGEKIVFDTSFFYGNRAKTDTPRNFQLDNFDIKTKAQFVSKKRFFFNVFTKIKGVLGLFGFYQDDFYQSEKYFINIADVIRQDFKLKNKMSGLSEIILNIIRQTPISVSVHVRRGDYVQNAKTKEDFGECLPEYYEKALNALANKLGGNEAGEIHLFVFSDDIEWVKNNIFFKYPVTFVSNPAIPDFEELILMSKCNHHIVANSSFSWWGAWLNPNPQKIIVAPKKWLNIKPKTYKDTVPNSWIKI